VLARTWIDVPTGAFVVPETVTEPPDAGIEVVDREILMVSVVPATVIVTVLDRVKLDSSVDRSIE
jgi:hypothetical protein